MKGEMKNYQHKLRTHVGHMAEAVSKRSQGERRHDESEMKLEWQADL
jgi:hypothetical protein